MSCVCSRWKPVSHHHHRRPAKSYDIVNFNIHGCKMLYSKMAKWIKSRWPLVHPIGLSEIAREQWFVIVFIMSISWRLYCKRLLLLLHRTSERAPISFLGIFSGLNLDMKWARNHNHIKYNKTVHTHTHSEEHLHWLHRTLIGIYDWNDLIGQKRHNGSCKRQWVCVCICLRANPLPPNQSNNFMPCEIIILSSVYDYGNRVI